MLDSTSGTVCVTALERMLVAEEIIESSVMVLEVR